MIRVSPNDNPDAVMRKAISAYLVGYSILHIRAQGQQSFPVGLRNYLKRFARNYLVGTEIVTDSPTELTLQILLNYQDLSVQSALRRMSIIAASMHKEAVAMSTPIWTILRPKLWLKRIKKSIDSACTS